MRSAVAALLPPRSNRCNRRSGEHMGISAMLRLQQGLQARLRRIVLFESGCASSLLAESVSQCLLHDSRTGHGIGSAAGKSLHGIGQLHWIAIGM
eukprot:5618917-Pyramimonas_sp.AAC.1